MKKVFTRTVLAVGFSVILKSAAVADVKLPAIFGDHMVLQQKAPVQVWGWADPGEQVSVKGSWQWFAATTQAGPDGTWSVTIKTPKAGSAVSLTVKGRNQIVLNDVLPGEVWICSGQSNMEWRMNMLGTEVGKRDIEKADDPRIRLFTVKQTIATTPKDDIEGRWQVCSPETVGDFSATGYYVGRSLRDTLDVPIGLISTNWGGTKAEAWTSPDGLKPFEQFSGEIEMLSAPEKSEAEQKQASEQRLLNWENRIGSNDLGIREKGYAPTFDDSGWATVTLPLKGSQMELADIDGIVWYRRTLTLPPSWSRHDLELHLGPIDDIDTVWVNGTRIGTTTIWYQNRVYRLPASILKTGANTIVVRAIDTGGEGGFTGTREDLRIGPPEAAATTCAAIAGNWKYKLSREGAVTAVPVDPSQINQNTSTVLYNGMIAPLLPFRIAGAIWYQGESNCYDPILYRTLFPAMITDWRQKWGQGDFPFYYVQIAPYQYDAHTISQAIREAQMMTLDAVRNVGMAVTMDIGEENDIHPRNKQDVGDRLARWALVKTYKKKGIAWSGPLYKSMTAENGKIRITFDYADDGLVAAGGELSDFMIAGEDRKFVPAKAVIDGDTVVVSCKTVANPVAVRYGWSNWVKGTLFNKAGLPASSFRTDNWPLK